MAGIVNKPDINYGIWASNGDVAVPSSEKVEIGHIVEKPKKEIMNWIENRQDQFMAYINQVGISEWDSRTTYTSSVSFVNRSGTVYKAKTQNIDKDPTLNQDIWEIAWCTYLDFYNLSIRVDNIENTDGYLEYYVQKSNPEFSVKTKGVGYGNTDLTSSFEFSDNVPTVTRDNTTVAEFSGKKSGNDVVTFEDLQEILKIKVGDLYTTTVNENPKTRLGYGTWARFAEGRTLVGYSSSVSNSLPEWIKTPNSEFGSYDQTLTTAQLPSHRHNSVSTSGAISDLNLNQTFTANHRTSQDYNGYISGGNTAVANTGLTDSVGGGESHNNVQPSKIVFIWIRTA